MPLLSGISDLLDYRLRLSVQASCRHSNERELRSTPTDSDTVIVEWICIACERVRKEEVLGSEMDRERGY
jgi:hypothetical protein